MPKPEEVLAAALRSVLADLPDGATIPDSEPFRSALVAAEFFLPTILGEVYRSWTGVGLDGIWPVEARKTAVRTLELLGVCCIINDQTITPLHMQLQVAGNADEACWLECRLGERGPNGMVREPYGSLSRMMKRVRRLEQGRHAIDWVYKVTYGKRDP